MRRVIVLCAIVAMLGACDASSASPGAPSPSEVPATTPADTGPAVTPTAHATASATVPTPSPSVPTPSPSVPPPSPSAPPVATPLPGPTPAPASLPVKARGGYGYASMTPLPDGRLLVVTGARGGDVVAVLGRNGRPATGWPVRLAGRSDCSAHIVSTDGSIHVLCGEWDRDAIVYRLDAQGGLAPGWPVKLEDGRCWEGLFAASDGSIRVLCDRLSSEDDPTDHIAFAFDPSGVALAGWPVHVPFAIYDDEWAPSPRLAGDRLVLASMPWNDASETYRAQLIEIDASGQIRTGTPTPVELDYWGLSLIGPDRVLYLSAGEVTAIDLGGRRPGWPITVKGYASRPTFGADGRAYVVTGHSHRGAVLAIDPSNASVVATSPRLRIMTSDLGTDCAGGPPRAPELAADGTVFVWKSDQPAIYALEPSLRVRKGWPYQQPKGSPPDECAGAEGLCCDTTFATARAVGPDGSLYLVLQRRSSKVGGRLIALERNGRVRDGWPVELRQPASMFEDVALGADGTVYALATEAEGRARTSATILAIEPDSTVRYRAVVAEP